MAVGFSGSNGGILWKGVADEMALGLSGSNGGIKMALGISGSNGGIRASTKVARRLWLLELFLMVIRK